MNLESGKINFNMNDAIQIKHKNHFKLYIPFKDKIIFEAELYKNEIRFYTEEISISDDARYFFEDKDGPAINRIVISNQIAASAETVAVTDYNVLNKVHKLYLIVAVVVAVLFMFAVFVFKLVTQ